MTIKTEKIVSRILYAGLLIVPVLPLVVMRSLFFPFISGKNFIFRIIIEILVVLWVWLMLTSPKWRPKSSFLLWAVVVTTVAMALSTIFAIWPYKAFWSNLERMDGLWAYLHYLVFFLMLASTLKKEKDWLRFFGVSLGVSIVMSFYGLLQLMGSLEIHQGGVRLDGTMGNATYLAIYLIFHIFLFAYFFFKTDSRWLKVFYASAILLELFVVYHTATRGAILGLIAGVILFATVSTIWSSGRFRRWAAALLVFSILLPIVFVVIKDARFIKNNDVLNRFSSISLEDTTTRSRFIIWGMAIDAWKERPILGWGPESFVYVFSKEYKSELWRQEPWFDRTHNVLLDWLLNSGIAGLLAYLSIFVSALLIIRNLFKKKIFTSATVGVFVGLFAAYFIHNLFVFDNFTSYLMFFSVLAYLHWMFVTNNESQSKTYQPLPAVRQVKPTTSGLVRYPIMAFTVVFIIFSIYAYNIKPMRAAASIIDALRAVTYSRSGDRVRNLDVGLEALKDGIARNTFVTTEIREQLTQYAERIRSDPLTSQEDKNNFVAVALEEMKIQVERFPYDVRAKLFLASLYSFAGDHENATVVINSAIEISPARQQFRFLLGEIQFRSGDEALALATTKEAYELDKENPKAIHNYAIMAIFNNQQKFATDLLQEHFGKIFFPDPRYVNAYVAVGNFENVVGVWEALVKERDSNNFDYRLGLAGSYLRVFRDAEAITQIQEAIRINGLFKAQGEIFIQQIRAGTITR